MAIVLTWETGFVMTEQLPCLKLDGRSITPENDLLKCLYKPCDGRCFEVPSGRVIALRKGS